MKKNLSILLLLLINTIIFADNVKQGLGISALHMTMEDFDTSDGLDYGNASKIEVKYISDGVPQINASKHINDIKERDLVELNIDLGQRGVAGDDSWGAQPQEKYKIKGNVAQGYSYFLIPFEKGTKESMLELSKEYANSKVKTATK